MKRSAPRPAAKPAAAPQPAAPTVESLQQELDMRAEVIAFLNEKAQADHQTITQLQFDLRLARRQIDGLQQQLNVRKTPAAE